MCHTSSDSFSLKECSPHLYNASLCRHSNHIPSLTHISWFLLQEKVAQVGILDSNLKKQVLWVLLIPKLALIRYGQEKKHGGDSDGKAENLFVPNKCSLPENSMQSQLSLPKLF